MDFTFLINVLMMGIAALSALIAFAVYRSSTDPEVIVYADLDKKRPSIVNLVIKNIGNAPAKNIEFSSDRPLPKKAYSIAIPDVIPEQMNDGPLIIGVPYLAPKQELVLTWGQYGGLKKFIGNRPIAVTSKFERSQKLFFQRKNLISTSLLDIECFAQTDNSDHNWDKKTAEELKKIAKEVKDFVNSYKRYNEN